MFGIIIMLGSLILSNNFNNNNYNYYMYYDPFNHYQLFVCLFVINNLNPFNKI